MRFSGALMLLALAMACLLALADAAPQYPKPKEGRVKIQAYRGPNEKETKGYGYEKYKFAPFGYYAHVPADDKPKGYHR